MVCHARISCSAIRTKRPVFISKFALTGPPPVGLKDGARSAGRPSTRTPTAVIRPSFTSTKYALELTRIGQGSFNLTSFRAGNATVKIKGPPPNANQEIRNLLLPESAASLLAEVRSEVLGRRLLSPTAAPRLSRV